MLPLAGEATQENNRVPFQITSRQDKIRVIYMEGTVSPPEEYRFIQDALQEDPNIECVSMLVNEQLAAQPVLYRVHDPSRGFPTARAELFTYDVVICSDIARGAFTPKDAARPEAGPHCSTSFDPSSPRIPQRALTLGEQYRFHFDMTKCIGCKCCVVACNEQNGNPASFPSR